MGGRTWSILRVLHLCLCRRERPHAGSGSGGGVDKIQMLLQPQASRGLRMMMAEVQPTLMIAGVGV